MPPDLREALEAAVTEAETSNETSTETNVEAASSVEADSAPEATVTATSDNDNQSDDKEAAASDETTAAEKPATAEGEKTKPASDKDAAQHRVDRPPQSWKKEAKGEWAALPLHVRQEVYRREQQVNQVLLENHKNREVVEQFGRATAPYMARLQGMGGAMPAIERLLQTEYTLATGNRQQTAQLIAKFIKDYEVDIGELDNILSGQAQQQPQQPDINALVQQQLQQALAPFYQQQQQQHQRVQQEAVMSVEDMSLNPEYPHFETVREDMADIIDMKAKKGVVISLDDAYTMAVRLNPETAGQMQHQASIQTATQHHLQAQRAKAAASSVTGSPASGGALTNQGDGSLRGAIEAAFGGQRL